MFLQIQIKEEPLTLLQKLKKHLTMDCTQTLLIVT